MGARQVSVSRTVAETSEVIFEILVDPSQHPRIDGSGSVREAHPDSARRLELGAKFGMDMKMGASYKILNTVVEFEENRLIAWRHFNGHRWRWQLEPTGDGRTRVTETFDWSTAKMPLLLDMSFFPRKNKRGMQRSLERLAGLVEDR